MVLASDSDGSRGGAVAYTDTAAVVVTPREGTMAAASSVYRTPGIKLREGSDSRGLEYAYTVDQHTSKHIHASATTCNLMSHAPTLDHGQCKHNIQGTPTPPWEGSEVVGKSDGTPG